MTTREIYESKHKRISFTITKGAANRGKGKNVPLTWPAFCNLLDKPLVSPETMQFYLEASQDARNEIKASAGWYMACATEGGHRKADTLYPRQIMTIDVDEPTPELWEKVKNKTLKPLNQYEYVAHITKSATARKPKFRLILLSSKPIPPDHFRNLNTILCAMLIDGTLNAIDDVCFRPAQLMYLPVISANQSWQIVHNQGDLVDPYFIAEQWGMEQFGDLEAWLDYAKIPASERQGKRRETQRRAERPREKTGIVGAFCRTFNVYDAIAEFELPYEPTEGSWSDSRYTYTNGSGSGGAVIYDDGDFLYSNHQSDPCGEQNVNAFDLVRLHRFRDLDAEAKEGTGPGSLPSFKAMSALALGQDGVRTELLSERLDVEAMFSDEDVEGADVEPEPEPEFEPDTPDSEVQAILAAPEVQATFSDTPLDEESKALLGWERARPPKNWFGNLDLTDNGNIIVNTANIATILRYDNRFFERIAYNEMSERKMIRGAIRTKCAILPIIPVYDKVDGDNFEDSHRVGLKLVLESSAGKGKFGYGLKVTQETLLDAVEVAAYGNRFHPVKDFLARHEWDGIERLETLFIRYLGLEDTPYHREVSRLTILAIVVRVFEPGHKFDFAPILEGPGGARKSTFVRMIGMGQWFSELTADLTDPKSCVEQMKSGAVVMELPELTALSRSDVETVKSFLSRSSDEIRLAYAREPIMWRRKNVFMGTTNNKEYLRDPTGNRRFWPLVVQKTEEDPIDTEALLHEMPQVYAEAFRLYREMRMEQPRGTLPLYLTTEEAVASAREAQEKARVETVEDGLAGLIGQWLEAPQQLHVVAPEAEGLPKNTPVLRTRVCGHMVAETLLNGDRYRVDRSQATAIGHAMSRTAALSEYATTDFKDGWGRQRWRAVAGFDEHEIRRGWALAPAGTKSVDPAADFTDDDVESLI